MCKRKGKARKAKAKNLIITKENLMQKQNLMTVLYMVHKLIYIIYKSKAFSFCE